MRPVKLDATDIRILSVLQQEGRITKLALAERVNLSATPCWERLKRLEQAGLITGYHARISAAALGPVTTAFTEITLEQHRQEDFDRFARAMGDYPEIVECWAVGGGIDFLLKVVTRDIEGYESLMEKLLAADLSIGRYFSYFVTKPVKEAAGLPLETLLAPEEAR